MKPPILIGILIAVLVLATALLAPLFRSSTTKAVDEARQQAALAERLLHRYDNHAARFDRLANPAALKDPQLDARIEQIRGTLSGLSKQYAAIWTQMKARAGKHGLSVSGDQTLSADASGLRRALQQYQAALTANINLLNQAAQIAKQARTGEGGSTLGVPGVSGEIEYTRASGLLAEAQVLRQEQALQQSLLLRLGAQWAANRANQDYLAGLDVREILRSLRTNLAEIEQQAADAAREAEARVADVHAREQEVAHVTDDLKTARDELQTLERQGFVAGNDESFETYRAKYEQLSARLRQLEETEQLLTLGGLKTTASLDDENLLTGPIDGEPIIGLLVTKRRAAGAEERSKRLAAAVTALKGQITFVEQAGEDARKGGEYYAKLQSDLDEQQKRVTPEIERLAREASEKEEQALKAVRDAVSAFEAAQQAAEKWKRDASEIQSAKDADRTNPRLKLMTTDPTIPLVGNSAKAAALVLLARVQAQRLEAGQSLINDMRAYVEMCPRADFKFDATPFAEQVATARDNALDALKKAEDIYKKLIAAARSEIKWIPQASLASVYHMMARVNPSDAATYLASAVSAAEEATKGREQSPYLGEHVLYRDHLRARAGRGAEKPEGEAPSPEDSTGKGG